MTNSKISRSKLTTASGHTMHNSELMKLLGLRPGGHLPAEGLGAHEIQGILVWVRPLSEMQPGRRRHRIVALCPGCKTIVPAGRLHQHKCKAVQS